MFNEERKIFVFISASLAIIIGLSYFITQLRVIPEKEILPYNLAYVPWKHKLKNNEIKIAKGNINGESEKIKEISVESPSGSFSPKNSVQDPNNAEILGAAQPEEVIKKLSDALINNDIEGALKMFDKGSYDSIKEKLIYYDEYHKKKFAESLLKATKVEISDKMITYEMPTTVQTRIRGQVEQKMVRFEMIKLFSGNWAILNF